jgi:hypothetical protein
MSKNRETFADKIRKEQVNDRLDLEPKKPIIPIVLNQNEEVVSPEHIRELQEGIRMSKFNVLNYRQESSPAKGTRKKKEI